MALFLFPSEQTPFLLLRAMLKSDCFFLHPLTPYSPLFLAIGPKK